MSLFRSFRRGAPATVVLFAALALANVASAQTSPADVTRSREAEARFQAGLKAYGREDYEGAYVVFQEAQAIYPRPSLLRNLALCELHTKRPLEALQHLQAFIAAPGTTPEMRSLAEKNLADAYAMTGHLSITAADGARIKVDGKEVGTAPLKAPVDVVIGVHGVDAESSGASLHEKVEAGPGALVEVSFMGAVVAKPTVVGTPGGLPTVIVPSPEEHPKYWNTRRTVGVAIAGVGVVGLVLGGVFGAERGGQTTDAANASSSAMAARGPGVPAGNSCTNATSANTAPCTALTNALNSNNSDAHLEESFLIGGAMLVAVGVVTTLWPSAPSPPAGTSVAPMVGPHVAGLSWAGSF